MKPRIWINKTQRKMTNTRIQFNMFTACMRTPTQNPNIMSMLVVVECFCLFSVIISLLNLNFSNRNRQQNENGEINVATTANAHSFDHN